MATAVLHLDLQKFPVGTTVGAYPAPGNARLDQVASRGSDQAPFGTATASAEVQSDGSLTILSLADNTAYIAAAQVSSVWQRATFRTPVSSAMLLARRPSWKVRRQAAGLS